MSKYEVLPPPRSSNLPGNTWLGRQPCCKRQVLPMIVRLALISCFVAIQASSAAADFQVELDGRPSPAARAFFLFFFAAVLIFAVAALLWPFIGEYRGGDSGPSRSEPNQSPESCDEQAALYRALKRKLDAETELDEARLKAALKKDELAEIQELIQNARSKRSASGGPPR